MYIFTCQKVYFYASNVYSHTRQMLIDTQSPRINPCQTKYKFLFTKIIIFLTCRENIYLQTGLNIDGFRIVGNTAQFS